MTRLKVSWVPVIVITHIDFCVIYHISSLLLSPTSAVNCRVNSNCVHRYAGVPFWLYVYIYQTHVKTVFDSMYQVLVSWYLVLPVLIFTQIFESSHEHDQSLSLSMTDGCSIVISRIKTTSLAMSYIYSFCKPQYLTLTSSPWERKWTVVLMH